MDRNYNFNDTKEGVIVVLVKQNDEFIRKIVRTTKTMLIVEDEDGRFDRRGQKIENKDYSIWNSSPYLYIPNEQDILRIKNTTKNKRFMKYISQFNQEIATIISRFEPNDISVDQKKEIIKYMNNLIPLLKLNISLFGDDFLDNIS